MPSQMKALFDATGSLWTKGALDGKPGAMFTGTASQGGGQETTISNCESFLILEHLQCNVCQRSSACSALCQARY